MPHLTVAGRLQGDEFATKVLADLQVAREFLSPLLTADVKFEQLAEHIKNYFPSEESLARLEGIETSLANLPQVQLWFARVSGYSASTVCIVISLTFSYPSCNTATRIWLVS
jgi:hypothetical protein